MRLRDLEAYFIRYESRVETYEQIVGDPATWKAGDPTEEITGPREHIITVDTLGEAQGIMLQCPICRGGHYLQVTFADRGVAPEQGSHGKDGKPTRWSVSGTGLDYLTTAPSIQLDAGCEWHGYITNGDAA